MIVSRSTFDEVIEKLKPLKKLSLDTETTGLRPYHGDRIFSLILATTGMWPEGYYFNFWPSYPGVPANECLTKEHLNKLKILFDDPEKTWFIHNASFDMHMLGVEGIELAGEIFCTLVQGRVEYNEHLKYDLDTSLSRIGLRKDSAVENWIDEHKAFEQVEVPGKKQKKKNKFYFKVPYEVIVPYGLSDAIGGASLGNHLQASIESQSREGAPNMPPLLSSSRIESRLAKTVYRMERTGVKIDRAYVQRALKYEADRAEKAAQAFKQESNRDYAASPKLFADLFASERDKWVYTDKGNPSFDTDTLKKLANPLAKSILTLRDAKSKLDFYNGFLWHADDKDIIHPHFNSVGTRTFRFSSSDPNLQNLTSEEATYCRACKEWSEEYTDVCPLCDSKDTEHPEFMVRRAFVPRPGYVFVLPDFDQMEYKMMLDYAKYIALITFKDFSTKAEALKFVDQSTGHWTADFFTLIDKVVQGFDIHKATGDQMGVSRKYAKTLNFMLLYGGGPQKLADALGISLQEAIDLRNKYFNAIPYVRWLIDYISGVARGRGWVSNWAGYRYNFPNKHFAYTGPNTVIQGGCAAVVKVAMNSIDELLLPTKSKLVLTIHDELPCEIHESELVTLPRLIKVKMEQAYTHRFVPLTVGMEWSDKSLADKKKGFPV